MSATSLSTILRALAIAAPTLAAHDRATYARILYRDCARFHLDAITLVALVRHESRWKARARSKDGLDFGLGQLRAMYLPATARSTLLDGPTNLALTIRIAHQWEALCKTKIETDSPDRTATWISGYATGVACNRRARAVQEILAEARALRRKLQPVPPSPATRRR